MSNVSGASSGSTSSQARGRVVGVPKRCWYGKLIMAKLSKSESNPYWRYFRCGFAAANKLSNDNHTFKWLDEALCDEIESLTAKNIGLEQQLKELKTESLEFEKMVLKKVQIKLEKVEDMLSEAKASMTKMIIAVAVAIGCMIFKLVG